MWKSEAEPNEDKSRLVQGAKRLLHHDDLEDSTSNIIKDTAKKQRIEIINNMTDINNIKCQTKSETLKLTQLIDVSAHLAIIKESLTTIGQRLQEHQGQINGNISLSILLNSLLYVLGTLQCLTQLVPKLNVNSQATLSMIMDDIAYIMSAL